MKGNSGPSTPWGLLGLLSLMTVLGSLAQNMYLPAFPQIGADLAASPAETQATVAIYLIGNALGQLYYGPGSDRLGRKPMMTLGVIVFLAGSVTCAMADSIFMMTVGRFVQAIGGCAGGVVARAVIRDLFPPREVARLLTNMMLIMGLSPILAPLVGSFLLELGSWRVLFWVLTGLGVMAAIWLQLRFRESLPAEAASHARGEHPLRSYIVLLTNRKLLGYALGAALSGAILFVYVASSPALLIDQFGFSPRAFGWVFAVNAAGVIGGNQINGMLLRRHTADWLLARLILIVPLLALLLLLVVATGFGGRLAVLVVLFGLLSSFGFTQINMIAGALDVDPKRAGAISAIMGAMSPAAGAAMTALAGAFYDGTPGPMAGVMLGCALAAVVSIYGLVFRGGSTQPSR